MSSEGQDGHAGLHVLVGDERGRAGPAPGLARWLKTIAPSSARGIVSVAVVSDGRIRKLNGQYLGHDYATDVLSFPASDQRLATPPASRVPGPATVRPGRAETRFLGDIVIARGVARRQARAAGHSERTEIRVLALHGLLHLLGYDHERDDGRMLRVERRLRRKGGLPEGLIERRALSDHPRPRVYARGRGTRITARRGGGVSQRLPEAESLRSRPRDKNHGQARGGGAPTRK
jgi:probable rRNA maturation factor